MLSRHAAKALKETIMSNWPTNRLHNRWLQYEYRMFDALMNNNRKPRGVLLSYIQGFRPQELPLPLLAFLSVPHDLRRPAQSLNKLLELVMTSPRVT